jgi:mannose-1-phosphate guanylyltransferase / mannose-6-phosphate isomerase
MIAVKIIPIILSGGAGTRLWPLSRAAKPKQFLSFGGELTLIQETVKRCSGQLFDARPIVVAGENQRFLVAEDLRAMGAVADIVLEPMRRDSCAAIVAGCLAALKRSPDAMVLVVAADHHIPDTEKFAAAIGAARVDAAAGFITSFGVRPTSAATGYGYIKPGAALRMGGARKIDRFVEKPNLATAQTYMREGYLWNSGNFLFVAKVFIEEVGKHAPEILSAVKASFEQAKADADFFRLEEQAFARSPQISADYAVMEKTDKAAVFAVDYHWSDIGSWDSVYEAAQKDLKDNAIAGRGVVLQGSNNLVHAGHGIAALVGVDNLIVVTTAEAVLVIPRGHSEKVKDLVAELKAHKFDEAD